MNNDKLKILKERGIISDEEMKKLQERTPSNRIEFNHYIPEKVKEVPLSKLFERRPKMEFVLFKNCAKLFDFSGMASRREWWITMLVGFVSFLILGSHFNDEESAIFFVFLSMIFMPYMIILTCLVIWINIGFESAYEHAIQPKTWIFIILTGIYFFITFRATIRRLRAVQKKPRVMWIPFAVIYAACQKDKKLPHVSNVREAKSSQSNGLWQSLTMLLFDVQRPAEVLEWRTVFFGYIIINICIGGFYMPLNFIFIWTSIALITVSIRLMRTVNKPWWYIFNPFYVGYVAFKERQ